LSIKKERADLDDNEVAGVLVVRVPEDALCLRECPGHVVPNHLPQYLIIFHST